MHSILVWKCPGRWLRWLDFRKHSGPTPADDMAAQIITDFVNFTLDFKHHGFCLSTLPPDSGTLISKWKAKFTFIWKEDFGPLSNSPKWLGVALFLKMSEHGDSWCTDSSFSSLLVKLSQVFESALLDRILKLVVIPFACAHFPSQFLPYSQLCI